MSSEEGAAAARLSLELVTIRTRLTVPLVRWGTASVTSHTRKCSTKHLWTQQTRMKLPDRDASLSVLRQHYDIYLALQDAPQSLEGATSCLTTIQSITGCYASTLLMSP